MDTWQYMARNNEMSDCFNPDEPPIPYLPDGTHHEITIEELVIPALNDGLLSDN